MANLRQTQGRLKQSPGNTETEAQTKYNREKQTKQVKEKGGKGWGKREED